MPRKAAQSVDRLGEPRLGKPNLAAGDDCAGNPRFGPGRIGAGAGIAYANEGPYQWWSIFGWR
jgi:hypothetical protein